MFPETDGVTGYKDISPRGGVAYDLFGNGKTSLKVNFGKYLEPTSNNNNYILSNPIGRIATTTSRSWTDNNNNFLPDCDLRSPAAQSPATTGSIDTCGAMNSQTFGTTAQTTAAIDPKILEGWGVRSNDWQIGVVGPAAGAAPRVGRGRLLPPLAEQLHDHRQPGSGSERLHRSTASPLRRIRICRAAAATW